MRAVLRLSRGTAGRLYLSHVNAAGLRADGLRNGAGRALGQGCRRGDAPTARHGLQVWLNGWQSDQFNCRLSPIRLGPHCLYG